MTILQKHLIFIPLALICFGGLFGLVVMLLWNWLMPRMEGIFHFSPTRRERCLESKIQLYKVLIIDNRKRHPNKSLAS